MSAPPASLIAAVSAQRAALEQFEHEQTYRAGKQHEPAELAAAAAAAQWNGIPCPHGVVPAAHRPVRPDGIKHMTLLYHFPFHYLCGCCANVVRGSFRDGEPLCRCCVAEHHELISENEAAFAADSFYEHVMIREPAVHYVGIGMRHGQRTLTAEIAPGAAHEPLPELHCGLAVIYENAEPVAGRAPTVFHERYRRARQP